MEEDEDDFLYGPATTTATAGSIPTPTTIASSSAPQHPQQQQQQQGLNVSLPVLNAVPNSISTASTQGVPGLTPLSSIQPHSEPGNGSPLQTNTANIEDTRIRAGETEELEEGEEEEQGQDGAEEEEDSDSDIEFVIERKDGSRPEPPPQPSRYNSVRMAPPTKPPPGLSGTPSNVAAGLPSQQQLTHHVLQTQTQQHPPQPTSKLDLTAVPSYNDKPLTQLSLEDDILPGNSEKPWRKPGTDVTDYFNYGFDEFTWTAYCQKQENLREEFNPQKMMEQMMLMGQFAMPALAAAGVGAGPGALAGIGPGPAGMMDPAVAAAAAAAGMMNIPPEMQAAMMTGYGGVPGAGSGADMMMGDPSTMYGMQGGPQGGGMGVQSGPGGPQGGGNVSVGMGVGQGYDGSGGGYVGDPRQQARMAQSGPPNPQHQHQHQQQMGGYGAGYDPSMMQQGGGPGRGGYVGGGGRGNRGPQNRGSRW